MNALPPWLRPSNSGTSASLFVRLGSLTPPPMAALSQYGMLGRGVPCRRCSSAVQKHLESANETYHVIANMALNASILAARAAP